jgi:hypothetical protein
MDQLDLNDVRAAIGAIHNNVKALNEKMDDVGALAARCVRLEEFLEDAEGLLAELPRNLRSIAADPMLAAILGGPLGEFADDIERNLVERKARRAAPPPIERLTGE